MLLDVSGTDEALATDARMAGAIALISKARKALAEAKTLNDLLSIRDQAEAVRHLLKVQSDSLESQNEAAEIKIEAECRLGEMLAGMVKPKNQYAGHATLPALSDLGIHKMQSHRWQLMASVPNKERSALVAAYRESGKELTSIAVQKLAKRQKASGTAEANGIDESIGCMEVASLDEIPEGKKFGTIYADPPWAYTNSGTRSNVRDEYATTMTVDEIAAMPVERLAATDAHLHMWVTKDFIFDAKQVMDAWGFIYKSMFVWCKPRIGLGNYWRVSHEMLLLGVRGNAKRFAEHTHRSWLEIEAGKHSSKPEEVRQIIERVSPGPYLELFARKPVAGWCVFGDQIGRRLFPA